MTMTEQLIPLNRLKNKGVNISVRLPDIENWQKMIEADPTIPWSFLPLRRLGQSIFRKKGRSQLQLEPPSRGGQS